LTAEPFQYVPWYTNLLKKVNYSITKECQFLDFGCGDGECVRQFRVSGFNAFGCDIEFPDKSKNDLESYFESGIIRKIEYSSDPTDTIEKYLITRKLTPNEEIPYRLPFDDNVFDVIVSGQVFEHVMNYRAVLSELRRITKPDGINVHIFPGRWTVREPHTYVPFASAFRPYWWMQLWALVGIRNEFQIGKSARETALRNYWYLKKHTNYLSRKQILQHVSEYFEEYRFAEEAYFYVSEETRRRFDDFPFILDFYRNWYSDTHMRVLVCKNKKRS